MLLACTFHLFASRTQINVANSTLSNATYNATTQTLSFTNVSAGGKATLPVKGDLSAYQSLVLNLASSNVTISVKITFIGSNGLSQSKVIYQNAVSASTIFQIMLTDTSIISARNNITSIAIGAKPGGTYVQFNSVYFVNVDTGGVVNAMDTITVDTSKTYQTVTGFGGMGMNNDWSTYLSNAQIDLAFGKGTAQLGLNIMRVRIDPTGVSKWATMVAALKRAKTNGALILATPWTPPITMKSNGKVDSGSLKNTSYAAYAAYLKSFVTYMSFQGITIDAISVQNEPDWQTSYESCVWTPSQMYNFVKTYGDSLGTKCLAAESLNFNRSFTDSILNDSVAVNKISFIGGHLYGSGLTAYNFARQKGKEVWMTEHLLGSDSLRLPNWSEQLTFAKELNDCMLANFNAYIWWHIRRFYGIIGDGSYGSTNGVTNKRGYLMSQFAQNITGLTRVATTNTIDYSDDLQVSSYLKEDKLVVMVINLSRKQFNNVAFNLPFNPLSVQGVKTNSTSTMITHNVVLQTGQAPITNIDSQSVNTFTFTFVPNVLPIKSISLEAVLNQGIVNLTWNTIGEGHVGKFVIEKSLNGNSFFAIDTVVANNKILASYDFSDNNIESGRVYYRIKALNIDGSVIYSSIASVDNEKVFGEYHIFPNPITGSQLNIVFKDSQKGNYQLVIYNSLGQLVMVKDIAHIGGTTNYSFALNKGLISGDYKAIIKELSGKGNIVFRANLVYANP